MKRKTVTILLGAALIMTCVNGCGRTKKTETEAESIIVSEIEVIAESETEKNAETESDIETETESETEVELETESDLILNELEVDIAKKGHEENTELENSIDLILVETESEKELQTEVPSGFVDKKGHTKPETETKKTVSQKNTTNKLETEKATETETETEISFTADLAIVTDRVNVRNQPSEQAEIQALLTVGMRIGAAELQGDWMKIRYEDQTGFQTGFVKSEFLQTFDSLYSLKAFVNIRKEARIDAEIVAVFDRNADVAVIEELENGWARIRLMNEETVIDAYVKQDYLTKVSKTSKEEKILEDLNAYVQLENHVSEAEVVPETETETEAETEVVPKTETEAETEAETKRRSEDMSEAKNTESDIEQLKKQFELCKKLVPDTSVIGMIYSRENKMAEEQLEQYQMLAETYQMEIIAEELLEPVDIDLIASELVGSADVVFCLEDEQINELAQTICAYAEEAEIPVIGLTQEHADAGCKIWERAYE